VARDRKSAKQRQAERRARRLAEQGGDGAARHRIEPDERDAQSADTEEAQFELEASAPPEELGRSDMVLEPAPDEPDLYDEDDHLEEEEVAEAIEEETGERPKPREDAGRRQRGRVLTFLSNVWAELQRVQWPNRQQVTTLTGVVIGFVLIAGGYLGLLDAIFSRVIEAIL
jgi:preprotein translocase subunit SecE